MHDPYKITFHQSILCNVIVSCISINQEIFPLSSILDPGDEFLTIYTLHVYFPQYTYTLYIILLENTLRHCTFTSMKRKRCEKIVLI